MNTSEELFKIFNTLADQWEGECTGMSMIGKMFKLPSYKQIIDLGPDVVPLILERIRTADRGFWLNALRTLTGENPVHKSHAGDTEKMEADWINWGIVKDLIKP